MCAHPHPLGGRGAEPRESIAQDDGGSGGEGQSCSVNALTRSSTLIGRIGWSQASALAARSATT